MYIFLYFLINNKTKYYESLKVIENLYMIDLKY